MPYEGRPKNYSQNFRRCRLGWCATQERWKWWECNV